MSQETTDQEFKDYFAQFGRVVDATLMMDKDTGRPRGFGFVTFESEAGVDACINVPLEIHGKPIEVKKAQPRGNLREEEESQRRMKFQRNNDQSNQGGMGQGMGGNMGNTGMSPQMMAQYFQRMNNYIAMMAMRNGMPMNPQMQQMMQMQQMQQMMGGRGGPGGQNMMTPQMMQQMQQQMQQQQQMMQQQGGDDGSGGYNNNYGGGGGGGGRGGYHHQGRGGRRGGYGGHNDGGHGGGYGGGGGNYGGQQSYEGMYDDVPQGGGQNAPPANAPTGPKNAGKPGANYRGGGRGGNRGFHPYAR